MKFGTGAAHIEINVATRATFFSDVTERLTAGTGFALATLNLDHLTKLPIDPAFAEAYRAQDVVVADGRPVVWLSRLAGTPVELMPGSDLILPLCELAAKLALPVALVGSSDAALRGAAAELMESVPGLNVCLTHAPPLGFDPAGEAAAAVLRQVAESGAGLCFVALGAPKQEIFAARGRQIAPHVGFASIGAGLDFICGHQIRAPMFLRTLALEWLWRAMQSPGRMVPRYAKCFAILPGLAMQALRQR